MKLAPWRVWGIVAFLLMGPVSTQAIIINNGWITEPGVYGFYFGPEGPDGVLGTADDLPLGGFGVASGYSGGLYQGPAGVNLSANVKLISTVVPIGNGRYQYDWWITNTGTGPFVEYWDNTQGRGPDFLIWTPLYGTAGPDRIPSTADDMAPETQHDWIIGGEPVLGLWGGRWNPTEAPQAPRYAPIPEPASILLLGVGLAGLFGCKRRIRRTKK